MSQPQFVKFQECAGRSADGEGMDRNDVVFDLSRLAIARFTYDKRVVLTTENQEITVHADDAERVWNSIKSLAEFRPQV